MLNSSSSLTGGQTHTYIIDLILRMSIFQPIGRSLHVLRPRIKKEKRAAVPRWWGLGILWSEALQVKEILFWKTLYWGLKGGYY